MRALLIFLSYRYNQVSNILQSGIDIKDLYETRDFEKINFTFASLDPNRGLRFVKIHFIVSVPSLRNPLRLAWIQERLQALTRKLLLKKF